MSKNIKALRDGLAAWRAENPRVPGENDLEAMVARGFEYFARKRREPEWVAEVEMMDMHRRKIREGGRGIAWRRRL